jgi:hypothetical protein
MNIAPTIGDDRPIVVYRGREYRLHKPLGTEEVRIASLDDSVFIDVLRADIEYREKVSG